jgi:hypothetical protein
MVNSQRRFLGLSSTLWRLSSVVAVAQFAWSIWYWQFSVFLMDYVAEWQIGVVLAAGSVATLVGYPISGTVHCKLDKVGHKSLCPPRNGTGVILLEAAMCRANLKEKSSPSYLSSYWKMSKIVQLLRSCCIPSCLARKQLFPQLLIGSLSRPFLL